MCELKEMHLFVPETDYLYIQSCQKMLFILTVHSSSFLPSLYNISHRLSELIISLFLSHGTYSQKYLMKTATC